MKRMNGIQRLYIMVVLFFVGMIVYVILYAPPESYPEFLAYEDEVCDCRSEIHPIAELQLHHRMVDHCCFLQNREVICSPSIELSKAMPGVTFVTREATLLLIRSPLDLQESSLCWLFDRLQQAAETNSTVFVGFTHPSATTLVGLKNEFLQALASGMLADVGQPLHFIF